MSDDYVDASGLRSPFYRVATRAVIRDDASRVLAVCDASGTYELPGGGWEHDETFDECMRRELQEELGVPVTRIGELWFSYRGRGARGHTMLRLAAEVELQSHDFTFDEDEITGARFVDRDEFLALPWCSEDKEIVQHVNRLWPPVEKKRPNR